jgi:hypothetical protein
MKNLFKKSRNPRRNSFMKRLVCTLVLTVMLICSYAYFSPGNKLWGVSAQSKPLIGSFGFLVNASVAGTSNDGGSAKPAIGQ